MLNVTEQCNESLHCSDSLYICKCKVTLLLVIKLQVHAIVDFVVDKSDVVLVDRIPLFQDDLVPLGARLRRDQLLQVTHRVVLVAFDPDLFGGKFEILKSARTGTAFVYLVA